MASTGQTITNEITLETITFIQTSEDDGGAALQMEFLVPAGGMAGGGGQHFHPRQTESFAVLEGRAEFSIGDNTVEMGSGGAMTVAPGTPHFWTAVSDLRMMVTHTPGLGGEDYFEQIFAVTNRRRELGLLDIAVLDSQYPRMGYPAGLPAALWRAGFQLLAFPARLLGYGPRPGGPRLDGPPHAVGPAATPETTERPAATSGDSTSRSPREGTT